MTDFVIEKLTKYYTYAIRKNKGKTVTNMKKDILASYLHCTSNDERPNHGYCPKTEDSWCFYDKAIAKGETPKSHKEMKVYFQVESDARKAILNIYLDLSKEDLLERCLRGKTQNINEALHSKVWNHLSKAKFYGLKTVQINTCHTVLEHNIGYENTTLSNILGENLTSPAQITLSAKRERKRVAHSTPTHKTRAANKVKLSDDYNPGQF